MRLSLDRSTAAAGQVTFLAVNAGNINHELVVLPLPADQIVGTRPIGADGKIDEAGSLGEASNRVALYRAARAAETTVLAHAGDVTASHQSRRRTQRLRPRRV